MKVRESGKEDAKAGEGGLENKQTDAQRRAAEFLKKGCLPLFPPAPREWTKDEIITITNTPIELKWPPKNWKSMTPESKTLHWEYACIAAELSAGRTTPLAREDLRTRYSFLSLPGSKVPKMNGMCVKAQYYLFATLREIARGNSIQDCDSLLTMIENSLQSRDQSLDVLLQRSDNAGVRLRLDA